jgi:UDP-3-O-[3-hydroxymyristoyl] glucosamine N-acyltransferase
MGIKLYRMLVREIAALLGADFEGDGELEILRVSTLEAAGPGEISFVANEKAARSAGSSRAGCLLVPLQFEGSGTALIRVPDPRAAIALVIDALHPKRRPATGVHRAAVIGQRVTIGEGTSIGPGCSIGDDARIGQGCTIHANVTVYENVTIGDRVVLHSGAVIGADGFGFVLRNGAYENFPQVGTVEIGDDVEIGANSCVDRAALGVTSIGDGTKLDNMVHIAHNCRIGRHVVIAAQTGMAGGVTIDDYAVIGGQVGIGDKAHIESKAVLGSGAGVLTSKIVRGGQVYWGTPARPLREYLTQLAALSRVPELLKEVRELKKFLGRE